MLNIPTKKFIIPFLSLIMTTINACNEPGKNPVGKNQQNEPVLGSFGYDLNFLSKYDQIIVLKSEDSDAQVIVSPKYQGKVFTSTDAGAAGSSFGWVNYKAFSKTPDAHMNAFGGENRLWLGPEGGKFSLFFKPDSKMVFENWKTPAAIDTESWNVLSKNNRSVTMQKDIHLTNYAGSELILTIDRTINILSKDQIAERIGMSPDSTVRAVGYETENIITNKGDQEWTEKTGMPCIWLLDMFKPSPKTTIVIPFSNFNKDSVSQIATTNYFGEIPADRLKISDTTLFFKADGKSRGKLGIRPTHVKPVAGSYDAENKCLTIILFDIDQKARYLNQEWNTSKPSFSGDAMNAYNDGPLSDGSRMGPFYEIESVSPPAFLKPMQSLKHHHAVFHFTGDEKGLDAIARKLLGVPLDTIEQSF
jgi:hypothetical protein